MVFALEGVAIQSHINTMDLEATKFRTKDQTGLKPTDLQPPTPLDVAP